ncbi:MAG: NADPH:quinone oxidoreductase family protein [Proteobacteria bacterium]|nr:NADPH:quinone oxidoreductase family protein [Pseudomonadota bacterium]
MKAVWVREYTDYQNLAVEDVPEPEIRPGHVRIDVRATGVSFAVSLWVSGRYQRRPPLPFAPGTEVAGVIAETGPGATRFKVGDRVAAAVDWGGMAEAVVADEVGVHAIPDSMDFAEAIALPSSYATACAALTWPHLLDVRPGQTLLVHGCAGGVGLAAVEIGKLCGARVVGAASTAEKRAAALDHGADHVIDYQSEDFRERVLEITGGRGTDAVLDPVGGDVFDQSLRCLAAEGRIMPVGFTSGRIPSIPANILLVKNISVRGLNWGYYLGWSPDDVRLEYEPRVRDLMDRLCRWYEQGGIRPHISHRFPLDRFQEAMAAVMGRRSIGRVALVQEG